MDNNQWGYQPEEKPENTWGYDSPEAQIPHNTSEVIEEAFADFSVPDTNDTQRIPVVPPVENQDTDGDSLPPAENKIEWTPPAYNYNQQAPVPVQDSTTPAPSKTKSLIALGLVAVLVIAGGVGGFWWWNNTQESSVTLTADGIPKLDESKLIDVSAQDYSAPSEPNTWVFAPADSTGYCRIGESADSSGVSGYCENFSSESTDRTSDPTDPATTDTELVSFDTDTELFDDAGAWEVQEDVIPSEVDHAQIPALEQNKRLTLPGIECIGLTGLDVMCRTQNNTGFFTDHGSINLFYKGKALTGGETSITVMNPAVFLADDEGMYARHYAVNFDNSDMQCSYFPKDGDTRESFSCGLGYTKNFGDGNDYVWWTPDDTWETGEVTPNSGGWFTDPKHSLSTGQSVQLGDFTCKALGGEDATCSRDDKTFSVKNGTLSINDNSVGSIQDKVVCGVDTQAPEILENISEIPVENEGTRWRYDGESNYNPCAALSYAVITQNPGGNGGTPMHIMFFHDGEYIGTATSGGKESRIESSSDDSVTVAYVDWDKFLDARESGADIGSMHRWNYTTTVTFRWNGSKAVVDGDIPDS